MRVAPRAEVYLVAALMLRPSAPLVLTQPFLLPEPMYLVFQIVMGGGTRRRGREPADADMTANKQ